MQPGVDQPLGELHQGCDTTTQATHLLLLLLQTLLFQHH
jgi:hypothetical protein